MGSGTSGGWPFWTATSDERIDAALRLAGLGPGERLVDLGCGDGRVLLRAAEGFGAVADRGDPGIWGLSVPGCDLVATAMAEGRLAAVLDEARRIARLRAGAGARATPIPRW